MKKIQKILVPLDGSKSSIRALNLAISIASSSGSTITGFHVIRFPINFSSVMKKHYKKTAQKIMSSASKLTRQSKIIFKQIIRFDGYVGNEIVKYSQDNKFDLIVIGSRGPSPIAEMFLGSVANYVMTKSKIPVLLVK
jgi:nucleotide-binding universal stress UspA family protein